MMAAKRAGVPARVYVHARRSLGPCGRKEKSLLETAERATLAASTHQLAVSRSLAELVVARGLAKQPPAVLGAGSVLRSGHKSISVPQADRDPRHCIYIGRVNRDKGIDVLVRVFREVRRHCNAASP